jgi:hypothetical protein
MFVLFFLAVAYSIEHVLLVMQVMLELVKEGGEGVREWDKGVKEGGVRE